MKELDALKMINSPAFDALQQLQKSSAFNATLKLETAGAFAAARELQSTLSAMKTSIVGANTAFEEYSKIVAPISESIKTLNISYAPIFEKTKTFDTLNIKGIISGLQTSSVAMSAISELNLSGIASIIDSLPKYDFLSDMISDDFSVDNLEKMYEDGEITQEEINEEIAEIVNKKQFSPQAEWDKIKKSKWFIAIKILFFIVCFICEPVVDDIKEKTRDTLGITEFWEGSGIYELIDTLFSDAEETVISENEAKAIVDKNKTGNISKQKREDLLTKIKEIRTFISAAPQDENTGNLLLYLSELEKDVNGKKYGLVFEQHQEEIDEVLATHTPVLTEQNDLYIANGGEMNFLIEGDNLASLQLLEKTHKGKIDLIYIDPPYNTGNQDFIYDDAFVDKNDLFSHSKWLSFMKSRLQIAYKLLSENGYIFISIDDNEISSLTLLCDEIFNEANHINTITINMNSLSGVKMTHAVKGKRFPAQKEYLLLYKKGSTPPQLFIDKRHKEKWDKEYNLIIPEMRKGQFDSFVDMNEKEVNEILRNMHLQSLSSFVSENGIKLTDEWLWENAYRIFGTKSNRPLAKRIKDETFPQQIMCYTNNDGNIRYFRSDFNREARDPRIELVQAEANSSVFLSDNWIDISNDGGVAQEGGVIFPNGKKPLQLITRILLSSNNPKATVLDFFAGSGTTGHAVLKQNAIDGGSRRFILCTNNQNEICRNITYRRLHNVIKQDDYAASLKYYKVDYIPISERMYYEYADELLTHIRELVELENSINFENNTEIGIVLTEGELDDFINSLNNNSSFNKVYLGHDILLDAYQAHILKEKNVTVNIIPDYYYRELEG